MVDELGSGGPSDWFLSAAERGNRWTSLDRHRDGGEAWSSGNEVRVHVDGASYFPRLLEVLNGAGEGDRIWFTDWEGHADERLGGPDTSVGKVLGDASDRGVLVRGLLWRSHPRQAHFDEQDNMRLARDLNGEGATLALDERVRRGGSHHQKLMLVGRLAPGAPSDVAFVGGIDLCHGRRDDRHHRGDPQATTELDDVYGDRPPWHDVQLEIHGPAVGDLAHTFRERWNDDAPLDHRNPLRAVQRLLMRQPRRLEPLPTPDRPPGRGSCHVQVLRTYPKRHHPYRFAPEGERSIAKAHLKALARARRLVYIEDQYLWSLRGADALADALRAHTGLHVVIVVPRHPDQGGAVTGPANRWGRARVLDRLRAAGGWRVHVYDLVNEAGTPIYVHAKVNIVDDVWMEVGSDNFNRRSWTHDSELGCAVLDERRDPREPTDPGGLGDGARVLARETRLTLWAEHLGRRPGDHDDLVDPDQACAILERSARDLSAWEASDQSGARPPGHLAVHETTPVPRHLRPIAALAHRLMLDPDGRSSADRRSDQF